MGKGGSLPTCTAIKGTDIVLSRCPDPCIHSIGCILHHRSVIKIKVVFIIVNKSLRHIDFVAVYSTNTYGLLNKINELKFRFTTLTIRFSGGRFGNCKMRLQFFLGRIWSQRTGGSVDGGFNAPVELFKCSLQLFQGISRHLCQLVISRRGLIVRDNR